MSRFKDLVRQNVNLLLRLETFEKPPYMRSVSKYDLQFREKNRVRFQPQDQTKHLLLPPYWSKHSLCAIMCYCYPSYFGDPHVVHVFLPIAGGMTSQSIA